MNNQREECGKFYAEHKYPYMNSMGFTECFAIWQAATSASDARYQARVCELEEALQLAPHYNEDAIAQNIIDEALSTTTPDTAIQRKVLEARIDERIKSKEDVRSVMRTEGSKLNWEHLHELHTDADLHIQELRDQLAALGE